MRTTKTKIEKSKMEIEDLLKKREELYRKIQDFKVDQTTYEKVSKQMVSINVKIKNKRKTIRKWEREG